MCACAYVFRVWFGVRGYNYTCVFGRSTATLCHTVPALRGVRFFPLSALSDPESRGIAIGS